jgi:serine/threonine protein kinase
MRGGLSQAAPSLTVLESAATPSLLSLAAAPLSQRGTLLFVCNDCWRTFTDGSLSACSCERPRPAGGWAAMPYLFRGRYLFVELLGRGGMGAVFRAYDQAAHDSPWVAVKVVQQSRPEIADLLKEMFQKEVAAAQMLAQHRQFFVQVIGHDGVDPAYLVLEHVPWQTLEEMLTSLPGDNEWLPPVQVARIGIAVLRGVAKMHFHRIVHRDLTPANIFIQRAAEGEGYDVKITDLGIWAFDQVQGDSESLTLGGRRPTIEGTPAYMSPEQSIGEPVGAASDLHTIGSLLWELATGVVPFPASHAEVPPHELVEQRVALLKQPPTHPAGNKRSGGRRPPRCVRRSRRS